MASAPGVILVRDGRPEQGHDSVTGELVDRPLEAMDPLRQDVEEAVENAVPFLGIHPLGEPHRVDHVGEQHGDLLALPFEGVPGVEDLLDEMSRGVGARVARAVGGACRREPLPTGVAESLAPRVQGRAARAGDTAPEVGGALATEAGGRAVLVPAARTPHPKVPPATL